LDILKTDRLILSEIDSTDAEFIITLLNTPGWLTNIGNRQVNTTEEAYNYIATAFTKSYRDSGFGFYKMVEQSKQHPIGICGLVKRSNLEYVDIGFALLPEFVGKGYALEAAAATLTYAQQKLGIKTIWAITLETNLASQKLLNNLGMKPIKKIFWEASGEELLCFSNEY